MDKKSGTALSDYSKKLEKLISDLAPGVKPQRKESLRGKVKPGEVVVILDGGDSNKDPLYRGAKTIRSRNG